jgi:hypothetical protein
MDAFIGLLILLFIVLVGAGAIWLARPGSWWHRLL